MKKQVLVIGGTLIISFFLVACGTNTKSSEQSKSVEKISIVGVKDKYIYSNNPVVISGKTNKNAKVKLIEVDDTVKTINSNKNGAFKFTITQPDEYKITVSKNSKSKSVKTSVENNPSIQSSISESMKNASSMANTSSDESVSESSSTSSTDTTSYQTVTYDQIARNPDDYQDSEVKLSGQVMQVQNAHNGSVVLLWLNDDPDQLVMVGINKDYMPDNGNILEDDEITVYGTGDGTQKYDTTSGAKNEVPFVRADATTTDSGKSNSAY